MRNDGWRAAIVALVLGCGPQVGTGSGSGEGDGASSSGTGGSSTTIDTFPPADTHDLGGGGDTSGEVACACATDPDDDDYGSCGYETTCELPMPCPRVTVTCPRPSTDLYDCAPEYVYDEAALRCALEVLRDDAVAHLQIDGTEDYGIYTGQEEFELFLEGGRALTRTRCMATDIGPEGWAQLGQSAAAAHFARCLDLEIAVEMYDCLWMGIDITTDVAACR
jgi:hypothetical protein